MFDSYGTHKLIMLYIECNCFGSTCQSMNGLWKWTMDEIKKNLNCNKSRTKSNGVLFLRVLGGVLTELKRSYLSPTIPKGGGTDSRKRFLFEIDKSTCIALPSNGHLSTVFLMSALFPSLTADWLQVCLVLGPLSFLNRFQTRFWQHQSHHFI